MNGITVQVPTKRYLKKYLYAVEYIPYDTPIDPRKGGPISLMVNLLFTGKLDMNFVTPGNNDYNDTIPLVLAYHKLDRYTVTITDKRLQFFHAFLHRSFHHYLTQQVMTHYQHGQNQSDTIKQIIHDLGIVDDIDFDALKKAVYRKKKTANLPLFS